MVARISVIALVMIVACPILLGYGMNLNEITVNDYQSNNDPVDVTQLLQVGTDWSIVQGDPYQLNSNVTAAITVNDVEQIYPVYNSISNVKTSTPMTQSTMNVNSFSQGNISAYQYYQIWADYIVENGQNLKVYVQYNNGNNNTSTIDHVIYVGYSAVTEKVTIIGSSRYYDSNHLTFDSFSVPNISNIVFTVENGPIKVNFSMVQKTGNVTFADISEGFYFEKNSNKPSNWGWEIRLPDDTISALFSINLDSITDSSYTMQLEEIGSYPMQLIKTTTNGVVSWQLKKLGTVYDLYYNPAISDNTYQVLLTDTGPNHGHAQFRYIGHWQKTIGEADYYQTYEMDYLQSNAQGIAPERISIVANDSYTSRTPTIRIDAAQFRAYEYPVVQGTLDAAAFKTNPATKISNIEQYGSQLIFGGNTYNVTNGNITINSHQIPVKDMVLDSIPNADTLQYDNRINGTTISTTGAPSTVQFVGNWSADITVSSMVATSYTKTEWIPGQFAWDGIDTNFLMVGMLASLAAFIGLGIYARRHGGGVIPLMIVCGGAAVLFFCLI